MYRTLPAWFEPVVELALDLRWTWNHGSDELWRILDAETWQYTQNPWWMLQSVSRKRIEELADNNKFKSELKRIITAREEYLTRPGWFLENCSTMDMNTVAYFSMEFALGEAMPLYAGGLGVLAGDYLKTASDMGVPLVGIGLLYQEGYLRQIINADGWQIEANPHNDPTNLPMRPVTDNSGGWLRVPLELPGRKLLLRVWQVQVGRVMLYLLDSNDPMNSPADRSIIYKLYDNRHEFRLIQEMALGIGGWRVIKALGLPVEICHLNEGHAAFVTLERAHAFMDETGLSFPEAWWATRAGNIFTTHTPVASGFDSFPPELINEYFRDYAAECGVSVEQLMELGRHDFGSSDLNFNMTLLALRGSIEVNGVSRIHEDVSKRIFQNQFPRWPKFEVPIRHVTNGVHVPSWDSSGADTLWTESGGKGCWQGTLEHLAPAIQNRSDFDLWKLRNEARQDLVRYARERYITQLKQADAGPELISEAEHALDPNILTIGFARRFTAYKRPNLLLCNRNRLMKIITNPEHPVQLIVAGKAHPGDEEGKHLIQEFVRFSMQPELRNRIVFLADYDLALAGQLVQGVDLWLNTPLRPWEACGTSGMKVLVNGGLNISELDGWWAEAYTPEAGWAIGDGREHYEPGWDDSEAAQFYELMENEIAHEFYDRDAQGIPVRWIARIRSSMSRLAPYFSSNRMLREYVENYYALATAGYRKRTTNKGSLGKELFNWHKTIERYWAEIHFGSLKVSSAANGWDFEIPVIFGEFNPDFARVEIFADPLDETESVRQAMDRGEKLPGSGNGFLYRGSVTTNRPVEHFSFRIIPEHPAASIPLEENHIFWYSLSH